MKSNIHIDAGSTQSGGFSSLHRISRYASSTDQLKSASGLPTPLSRSIANLPQDTQPLLAVIIDAEEEFDWAQPVSPANISVASMRHQRTVQRIHEEYGFNPIYLADYPVISQPDGYSELREWVCSGVCEVGAQLHTWVTPPITEEVSPRTSYQLNVGHPLEWEKLRVLTARIEEHIGVRPLVHRAGRNGIGAHTPGYLKQLGYLVDCSVKPGADYRADGGPDFRDFTAAPFWLDGEARTLLEIPVTASIVGPLADFVQPKIWDNVENLILNRFARSGLSRLRMAEHIRLTPEGMHIDEAKRLVRAMVKSGTRTFTITYHTPSLVPGNTPYVRNATDLELFLSWIREFYQFFLGEIGGRPTTCLEIHRIAKALPERAPAAPAGSNIAARPGKLWRSTVRSAVAAMYRRRNVREWPAWAGDLQCIKIPSNVEPREKPSPMGGANINIILDLLDCVRDLPGDIAECGVYKGATLATMALWCEQARSKKHIFAFDSFEGFDAAIEADLVLGGADDTEKRIGGFSDTSLRSVHRKILDLGQENRVRFVKGYFSDTLNTYSNRRFSFVHLDVDIYQSYKECLDFFYPRMVSGGLILLDEYNDPPWPGCNKAVDKFLSDKPEKLELTTCDNYEKYFFRKA